MPITHLHRSLSAAHRLLDMLDRECMPMPDQILHDDASILFFWHERKLVISVDPDRENADDADYEESVARNYLVESEAERFEECAE